MPATLQQVKARINKANGRDTTRLHTFAEALFRKADPDLLEEFDSDALYAMAVENYAFFERRAEDEVLVEVYNPSYQADGWEAPFTVLRVSLADRPFIVDSLRAELRRQGIELYHLLHPILSVTRDETGKVVALGERSQEGVREAFEVYVVERLEDERDRHDLEGAARRVLGDVVLATRDYDAIRQKAHALADYLRGLREKSAHGFFRERSEEVEEYADFMDWLDDDNFVFLGYREYDILQLDGVRQLQLDADSALGILSKIDESAYREPIPVDQIPESLRERVTGGRVLVVTKTNAESTVHRPARMDYIGLKKLSEGWQVQGEQRFIGLFTSKALSTPVEETPILRRKLRQVLELDNALPGSHDYKQIVSIVGSMPREELFWVEPQQLHKDIRTIMGLEQERGVKLTLRPDPLGRGLAVMVIMPRDRFNAEVRRLIQDFLAEKLDASHVDYQLAMGEDQAQVRFHFFFTTAVSHFDVDITSLERDVVELIRNWEDHLLGRLLTHYGEQEGRRLASRYLGAFDERYRADIDAGSALRDIANLEALGDDAYRVDLLNAVDETFSDTTLLKIYHHRRTLVLSEVMPVLENLGFRVLDQVPYQLQLQDGSPAASGDDGADAFRSIDVLRVQSLTGEAVDVRRHGDRLVEALPLLLSRQAESDRLNQLVLYAELDVRQVALLRTFQMHYAQLNAVTSRRFINDTLLAHPQMARLLVEYFTVRFDPTLAGDRQAQLAEVRERFLDGLAEVASLPEDRTLRGLHDLMEATQRTNFFLTKPYISNKIASREVASMPDPRPLFEIAVLGRSVEGVHLRGGKVARGGIRWSDRPDDFRTEVLGLMKTQMTKNAVIVPVGSKGGFVVKNLPADREALRLHVREQYRTFIRGLLDLTDNLVDGETLHPEGLVVYDEPDPYLVVAADKGTATFSDLANETAAEYDFWLGDAFASGGSQGYDHKAEGITARGAWECVARHFRELGVDVFEDEFSAVGIGDMSGDVFGNGMLYTERLKLVAAFNHLHIFLDPDPDPQTSYHERKRLFELPRSSWRDYDTSLLSEGGGVYDRSAKSIELSPQVRALLGIEAETLNGQDLICSILAAPVDLLWNGGVGTYVKASTERNAEVGDASNDAVRVDASDLRARVVGEGGNLGLTQLARVEYALAGGKINTDAIDNSGGVDMSDHEVNLKILLAPLVRSGDLSEVQRNRLLKEMTDEVSALVLKDNYNQSLALSMAERRSREDLPLFESLLEYLAERGSLNPTVEYLPTRRQTLERQRAKQGLTRPELAVLMAYAKMGLYRRLLETEFPDEPNFQHYLYAYFPKVLQQRFPDAIRLHPLRREIIATQFTNTVVDLLGPTFVHRTIRDTGASTVETIRAALVGLEILAAQGYLEKLCSLDHEVPAESQYRALAELVTAVEGVVSWMLLNDLSSADVAAFVDAYRAPLQTLREDLRELLPKREQQRFEASVEGFVELGFSDAFAAEIAGLDYLPSSVGVVEVSRATEVPLPEAAARFYALGERLSLGWLRDTLREFDAATKWEKIALGGLIMDLRLAQQALTSQYVTALKEDPTLSPNAFLERFPNMRARYDQALGELRTTGELSLASGGVLARLLVQAGQGRSVAL